MACFQQIIIQPNCVHLNQFMVYNPGEGTPYVGRYVMLCYTWVVFEKKLYFFREMGTFFQQNFCIFSARWVSILKKISVFAKQD